MSAAAREEEGHALVAEASRKRSAKPGFLRSLLGASSSASEEAAELYVKAANAFKLAKAWSHAGSAFESAADSYATIPDLQYEAAAKYADGARAYKNSDSRKAIAAYEKAVNMYTETARFQQCARFKKEIAEIYEAEQDVQAALDAYVAAADFYDMEDAKSNANSMRVKVAMLSATTGKYAEAAELYETVAQTALANHMLRYGARDHLLRAGLCRLCMSDIIGAQRAVEKYGEMDSTFESSREGRLLSAVVASVEEGNVEDFTNNVYEYDSLSKLDEWKTSILLKIKNHIKAEEDDLT